MVGCGVAVGTGLMSTAGCALSTAATDYSLVYGDLAIVERDGVRTPKSFFDLAVYGEPTAAFTERKKARWSR